MIDSAFLNEIQKFNLIINKRVTSKYTGERKSAYSGAGTIFRDHRMYSVGDNFKAIDWRVFARTDDLYVKQFEEERNLNVHILIDSSASMAYNNKFEFAGKLGLGFAFLAMKNNEKISFSTFSDSVSVFKGSRGRSQILSMLSHINSIKPSGRSNLYDALKMYKKSLRSKSFIVIISDWMMNSEVIGEALKLLGKSHTIKLVQVLDRDEKEMPLDGDFILVDSESGLKLRTYISKRAQNEFIARLGSHSSEIMRVCSGLGMKFHQFTTNKQVFDAFFEMLN
jgi:uncharacterized protein (DUF58 family)